MERFIRDKYEHRRYITEENGGLGGKIAGPNALSTNYSPYRGAGALGPRPSQSLPGNSHLGSTYDGLDGKRTVPKSSMSYSGRFGSGSRTTSTGATHGYQTRGTGGFNVSSMSNSMRSSAHKTRASNPMQRVMTLRELTNMGFSTQLALRAVEASSGELQAAVEWILQQKNTEERNAPSSLPRPVEPKPIQDLLDFGDPVPQASLPKQTAVPAPRAASSEVLVAQQKSTAANEDDFADFADFGAFESALPAAKPAQKLMSTAPTRTIDKLATLYKQSPPRQPLQSSGALQFSRIDRRGQQLSPTIRTTPSPKLLAQKASEVQAKVPEEDLGLTTFTSLAKNTIQLSKTKPLQLNQITPNPQSALPHTIPGNNPGPTGVPGPPSPVHVTVARGVQGASPPAVSPPGPGFGANDIATGARQKDSTSTALKGREDSGGGDVAAVEKTANGGTVEEEKEEEDPFAALSMMALTSAKAAPKKGKAKPQTTNLSKSTESKTPAPVAGAPGANSEINLDDLFG